MSEFEYRLLNALSETTSYSVPELAESAGLRATTVQRLIQTMAGDGRVTAYWQAGRTEYRLSPNGVGQRTMMRGLVKDGPVGLGDYTNALSMAKHQAGIAATRERMADMPLTERERSYCSAMLTWQHEQSRFDWSELLKRRALLNAAVTHGQLIEVFDGLRCHPCTASTGLPRPRFHGARSASSCVSCSASRSCWPGSGS
ncbi:helix-turn-helix domain-containing protein [Kribbella sp. CA-294648]|uniref:helix-turn-helix domain-containing protein n=1 Tax=Kribbella sp. CA-294648 TaxID=3239948 RepID=UPI003D8BEDD8